MADVVASSPGETGSRIHKSCDACKARKVRCPSSGPPGPCANCVRRKTDCRFSRKRLAHRRNVAGQLLPTNYSPTSNESPSAPEPKAVLDLSTVDGKLESEAPAVRSFSTPKSPTHRLQDLHVDRLLARARNPGSSRGKSTDDFVFVPGNGIFGGRNSLTFFSDSRLLSLSTRLKNNKVNEVVGRISGIVIGRLRRADQTATGRRPQEPACVVDPAKAVLYIQLYFERVHPVFALLDKASFETTVFSPSFPSFLVKSKPWLCLYHSVLALGCQYANGGTFEPGKGESWLLFSVALRAFSDLLLTPDSLTLLQALTVMSVYGLGLCGLAVEPVIMSEAVRRAQMMSHNTFTGSAATAYRKAFWTLYSVEKISSFHFGRSSGFVDSDIHCPIPIVPEAIVGEFNWFLPLICFARLLSRAYASLFSVGVSGSSNSYFLDVVSQLDVELETWRLSLPDNGFRPGGFIRPHAVPSTVGRNLALIVHYLYNSMLLTLSRTTLVYLQTDEDAAVAEQKAGCMRKILDASRSILELTTMIEVEPYTATWVIAGIPLTALFVLFDIVIHDPRHPETASNLALLDMAAGHFSRIEYASGGSLPGSLIAEFAKIARDYVNETQPSLAIPGTVGLPLEAAPSAVVPEVNVGDGQDDKQALIANIDPPQAISMPTVPSSFAEFALDSAWDQFSPGMVMGTDVMGLFNYFLPDLDPMFYPGPMGEYDFSQDPTGNMTL